MEIRVLNYFLTLAKTGSFSKAASTLYVSQPTLSRQIMQLEEELGVSLFVRDHKGITLTEEGKYLQQNAQKIMDIVNKSVDDLKTGIDDVRGTIYIGMAESQNDYVITDSIIKFRELYPEVTFDVYAGYGSEIKSRIDSGLIDIALLLEPVETSKYNYIRLPNKQTWGVLMNPDDTFAKRKSIRPAELVDYELCIPSRASARDVICSWFGEYADKLHIPLTYNLLSSIPSYIKKRGGYMVALEGAEEFGRAVGLTFVPFEPERVSYNILVWNKNQKFSKATVLFLEFIKKEYHLV